MNPLIEFYARKLYTWDREDARQEMLLALFLSLEKMKYCRNEGEMLSYLKTPANELKGLEPTDDKRQLKLF